MAKQISFYIAANSDTFMLPRPAEPMAMGCAVRCYATLTTIISFSLDYFNETEGIKKGHRLYISCALLFISTAFYDHCCIDFSK